MPPEPEDDPEEPVEPEAGLDDVPDEPDEDESEDPDEDASLDPPEEEPASDFLSGLLEVPPESLDPVDAALEAEAFFVSASRLSLR